MVFLFDIIKRIFELFLTSKVVFIRNSFYLVLWNKLLHLNPRPKNTPLKKYRAMIALIVGISYFGSTSFYGDSFLILACKIKYMKIWKKLFINQYFLLVYLFILFFFEGGIKEENATVYISILCSKVVNLITDCGCNGWILFIDPPPKKGPSFHILTIN